jgi:phosphatidate cytidylyltransferase
VSQNEPNPAGKGPQNWSDLRPRILSAAVLISVVALSIFLGGIVVATLVAVMVAGAYFEWEVMICAEPPKWRGYVIMILLVLASLGYAFGGFEAGFLMVGVAVLASLLAVDRWHRYGYRAPGILFLGGAAMAFLGLRGDTLTGIYATVFLAAVIWATDSGAYFFGRQIGGVKLSPGISPSKTWSGAIAGLLTGTLVGWIVWVMVTDSPYWIGIMISALLSITAQLGDLGESAIKRWFTVKDSGDIIPGHGGILDRVDSLTVGAIVLFAVGAWHAGIDQAAVGVLVW